MIRNEREYQVALRQLEGSREVAAKQREALQAEGLNPEEVEHAMQPLLSFQAQVAEEIAWYEAVRRGNLPVLRQLDNFGKLLIALRIASGLTQKTLAERLGVSEASVSRDERNEYHGITLERAQKILQALGASVVTSVEDLPVTVSDRELVTVR